MPTETMPNEALTQIENEKPVTEIEPKMDNESEGKNAAKPLRRKRTSRTADLGITVRKVDGKDGLFRVREKNNRHTVDLNSKTCTCPSFTKKKEKCIHIVIVENIDEIRLQKKREYNREHHKGYYQKNKEKIKENKRKCYQENKEEKRERTRNYQRSRYHSNPEVRRKKLEDSHKRHLEEVEDFKRFKIEFGGKCRVCGDGNLDHLIPHHPHGKEEKAVDFIHSKEFREWRKSGTKPDVVLMCANHHLEYETAKSRGEVSDIADFLKKISDSP